MARMVVSLSALILSVVLLASGNAFLMTLLGIRLGIEQVPADVIGWVLVCYSIGFVLGTLHVHRIIMRVGHIRAFAVFAALAAVVSLMYPMSASMVFWAFLRLLSGFCIAGVLVVVESWFSASATNANRSTLFAVYQVVFYLSAAGGQLMINVGDPAGFVPFSLAAILLVLALVPLSLTRMQAPVIEQAPRLPVLALARESFSGVAGAVISGVLISSFYALGPVYATQVGLDVGQTSTFMASAILAAMLLAWPMGRVCDFFDRRRVMFWVSVVAAVAAALVGLTGVISPWLLMLEVGVVIGLCATIYPIAVAITNDRMETTRIVPASATLLLSYGIGSVAGPVVMARLIAMFGPQGLFFGMMAFLVILALITSYRIVHTEDVPVEDQEQFVTAMPDSSAVLTELDPRNDGFQDSGEMPDRTEVPVPESQAPVGRAG